MENRIQFLVTRHTYRRRAMHFVFAENRVRFLLTVVAQNPEYWKDPTRNSIDKHLWCAKSKSLAPSLLIDAQCAALCFDLTALYDINDFNFPQRAISFCEFGPSENNLKLETPEISLAKPIDVWEAHLFETAFLLQKRISELLNTQWKREQLSHHGFLLTSSHSDADRACFGTRSSDIKNVSDTQCVAICKILCKIGFDAEELRHFNNNDVFRCSFALFIREP